MEALQKIEKWHKTLPGYVSFGLVELALAYAMFSLAIHTGSLVHHFVAFVLLFGAISNIVRASHHVITRNGKTATRKR